VEPEMEIEIFHFSALHYTMGKVGCKHGFDLRKFVCHCCLWFAHSYVVNVCVCVFSIRYWWSSLSHWNAWHLPTSSANTTRVSRWKGMAKNG